VSIKDEGKGEKGNRETGKRGIGETESIFHMSFFILHFSFAEQRAGEYWVSLGVRSVPPRGSGWVEARSAVMK
jgi:hypothetical protein